MLKEILAEIEARVEAANKVLTETIQQRIIYAIKNLSQESQVKLFQTKTLQLGPWKTLQNNSSTETQEAFKLLMDFGGEEAVKKAVKAAETCFTEESVTVETASASEFKISISIA